MAAGERLAGTREAMVVGPVRSGMVVTMRPHAAGHLPELELRLGQLVRQLVVDVGKRGRDGLVRGRPVNLRGRALVSGKPEVIKGVSHGIPFSWR